MIRQERTIHQISSPNLRCIVPAGPSADNSQISFILLRQRRHPITLCFREWPNEWLESVNYHFLRLLRDPLDAQQPHRNSFNRGTGRHFAEEISRVRRTKPGCDENQRLQARKSLQLGSRAIPVIPALRASFTPLRVRCETRERSLRDSESLRAKTIQEEQLIQGQPKLIGVTPITPSRC